MLKAGESSVKYDLLMPSLLLFSPCGLLILEAFYFCCGVPSFTFNLGQGVNGL